MDSGGGVVSDPELWMLRSVRDLIPLRVWRRAAAHTHHSVCIQADERESVPRFASFRWRAELAEENL